MRTAKVGLPFHRRIIFNESLTTTVHAQSPYSAKGTRDTLNTNDGIYNSLSSSQITALTLQATPSGSGYAGTINLGVNLA